MRIFPKPVHSETSEMPDRARQARSAAAASRLRLVSGGRIAEGYSRVARRRRKERQRATRLVWIADRLIVTVIVADLLLCGSEGTAVNVLAAVTGLAFVLWCLAHRHQRRVEGGPR